MSPKYQRLLSVPGYNRLVNDIIFIPRQTSKESTSVVVFFGGDIQVNICNDILHGFDLITI